MNKQFNQYLIAIGIRSHEYTYTDQQLYDNTDYFYSCFKADISPYKALLFLSSYLNNDFNI